MEEVDRGVHGIAEVLVQIADVLVQGFIFEVVGPTVAQVIQICAINMSMNDLGNIFT